MVKYPHDVFLSYSRKDESQVKQIATELKEAGIRAWFDEWELKPGQSWIEALDRGIRESRSIAVFVGSSGIGPWETPEVNNALNQNVRRGCPVIPVILPGVGKLPELPSFLDQFTWVDCRGTQTSQESLDKLIWGITGRRPLRSISQVGDEFILNLQRPDKSERYLPIYTLPNPSSDRLLVLTWETFGIGIENLRDQIKNYGYHLPVNACFGINDAGLVMATFLNASELNRVKLGYIKCERSVEKKIIKDDSFFPALPQNPTIILMDFEVKSGSALNIIIEKIREIYTEPEIYFAVFGAMTEKKELKIESFKELLSAENLSKLGIKDYFIACTMHQPGIEPPMGLK